jgi:hypothetical protein
VLLYYFSIQRPFEEASKLATGLTIIIPKTVRVKPELSKHTPYDDFKGFLRDV